MSGRRKLDRTRAFGTSCGPVKSGGAMFHQDNIAFNAAGLEIVEEKPAPAPALKPVATKGPVPPLAIANGDDNEPEDDGGTEQESGEPEPDDGEGPIDPADYKGRFHDLVAVVKERTGVQPKTLGEAKEILAANGLLP